MADRSYSLGVNHTFSVEADLTLRYCGGTFISGPPNFSLPFPFDNGWKGSNFFRGLQKQGSVITGGNVGQIDSGHTVSLTAFGVTAQILLSVYDLQDVGAGSELWNQEVAIFLGGQRFGYWNVGPFNNGGTPFTGTDGLDHSGPIVVPPESLSIHVSISVPAELWIDEIDSQSADRPVNAVDARANIYWKPTSDVTASISGAASGGVTVTPPASIQTQADFGVELEGDFNELGPLRPGVTSFDTLPATAGLGSTPEGVSYATAGGVIDSLPLSQWSILKSFYPDTVRTTMGGWDFDAWEYSPDGLNLVESVFVIGYPPMSVPIQGHARDWNADVTGIPVTFDGGPGAPETHNFTANVTLNQQPVPVVAPPPGYEAGDTGCARLLYGAGWSALTLIRSASLVAEDFAAIGGSNGWSGADLSSGPTYGSGHLTAVADVSGSPHINKVLKNDFNDLDANKTGWWTAHGASLSAARQAWWAETGDPAATGAFHVGDWYRVGCKLLSGSDVFNWSSYRYADLTAWADAACTITVEVTYDEIAFTPSGYDATADRTPLVVSYAVDLGTTSAAHRIDMASKAGHYGLRYVRSVKISFPTGRTVHLTKLDLVGASHPLVEIHHPSNDSGYISAMEDGKCCLFLSTRHSLAPNSLWGWPCLRYRTDTVSLEAWQSMLTSELAVELSMQEGWTATGAGSGDHSTPSYAVWLGEVFQSAAESFSARRTFGQMTVEAFYSRDNDPIRMEINLGNGVHLLAFDPDTFLPVQVAIEADDGTPAVKDTSVTNTKGAGRLEVRTEELYTIYAGKGTADESSSGDVTVNRTIEWIALTAKLIERIGDTLDYAKNPFGEHFLVEARANDVRQWLGVDQEADFTQAVAYEAKILSPSQVITPDHTHMVAGVDETGAVVMHRTNDLWNTPAAAPQTLDDSRTYVAVTLREAPDSSIHAWMTAEGGDVYKVASFDNGDTFSASSLVSTLPTGREERGDVRHNGHSWFRLHPVGDGLDLYLSDDGEEWQFLGTIAATAKRGSLAFQPDSSMLLTYYDGTDLTSQVATDDGADVWTGEGPYVVAAGVDETAGVIAASGTKRLVAYQDSGGEVQFARSFVSGTAWEEGSEG